MKNNNFNIQTSFFKALHYFYTTNKKEIKRKYKDVTKKYLDYNDIDNNPEAFLRKPQFEALEMYVFLKEFLDNEAVSEIFQDWMEGKGKFSGDIKFSVNANHQINIFEYSNKEYEKVYEMLIQYKEVYSNYIFALTMGLRKNYSYGYLHFL